MSAIKFSFLHAPYKALPVIAPDQYVKVELAGAARCLFYPFRCRLTRKKYRQKFDGRDLQPLEAFPFRFRFCTAWESFWLLNSLCWHFLFQQML
jgi:hypothetical protein